MRILIADDDPVFRLLLSGALRRLGHEVRAVTNGVEAWDAFRQERPPVLILDWMMPELDGLSLTRRMRAEGGEPYTYVILLTALGGKTSYLQGMEAGADDFVTKPFDAEQLGARLKVAERIRAWSST